MKIVLMVLAINLSVVPGFAEESSQQMNEETFNYFQSIVKAFQWRAKGEQPTMENNKIFNHQELRVESQEALLEEIFESDLWMVDCIMDYTYQHYSYSDGPVNTAKIISQCVQLREE